MYIEGAARILGLPKLIFTLAHYNTLQHTATLCNTLLLYLHIEGAARISGLTTLTNTLQHTATHCNTLQHSAPVCTYRRCCESRVWPLSHSHLHTATHCNTLQHTATHMQHTTTHCNTLQHTATHCNTLLQTAALCNTLLLYVHTGGAANRGSDHSHIHPNTLQHTCNKLQHTATHYNTLQHTATHCNTLQHTANVCICRRCYELRAWPPWNSRTTVWSTSLTMCPHCSRYTSLIRSYKSLI